jgi:hypothetical protein
MNTILVVGEEDVYSRTYIEVKFRGFLKEECYRCMADDQDSNDPFIHKYFAES